MVKKIIINVIFFGILLWLLLHVFPIHKSHADPQIQFELTCPAGSFSVQSLQSFNSSTGKYRQNFCSDANGNITQNGFTISGGVFTFTNHNNLFWAGPGTTPTIDQAKTACGVLPGCIVHISPGYIGPEASSCIANSTGYFTDQSPPNTIIHYYRALTPTGRCYYGFILGGRSFGALTKIGTTGFWTGSLADSTASQSNLNFVTNATLPSNGGAMNGSVNVILGTDSINVGTSNSPWVGSDGECDIQATSFDFPVNNCFGTNSQTNIVRANATQSIINGIGQHTAVNANVSTSGAQIINSYGALNELQVNGVGRNYSEYNLGNVLQDTETQIHSLITGASVTITAATESGQIVTITTSGVCIFTPNQEVRITGVTPAAYNGRYFVRSPGCNGGNTFTYFHPASSGLGAGTVFGIVSGLTPQTTTYWRNTNSIEHKPLADNVGWVWLTQGGSGAFRVIPGSVITSFIPHQFSAAMSPASAAGTDVGTAALKFANRWLGTAVTNNTKIIGSATTAARNLTLPDADSLTPSFLSCGTTSTCAKTNQIRLIILNGGPISLSTGTLTITALPFTSATSYVCSADDSTGINGIDVVYISGSSVTFNGTGTDSIRYSC